MDIKCGMAHTLVLTSSKEVYSCGRNAPPELQVSMSELLFKSYTFGLGQLGRKTDANYSPKLEKIENLPETIRIECGHDHSMCIDTQNNLFVFGSDIFGQLGLDYSKEDYTKVSAPLKHPSLSNVTNISSGGNHTFVKTSNNEIYAFGFNFNNQLGVKKSLDSSKSRGILQNEPFRVFEGEEDIWSSGPEEDGWQTIEIPIPASTKRKNPTKKTPPAKKQKINNYIVFFFQFINQIYFLQYTAMLKLIILLFVLVVIVVSVILVTLFTIKKIFKKADKSKTKYCPWSKERTIPPPTNLPQFGDMITHSYSFEISDLVGKHHLRIVSLNIEKGKQLDKVITQLEQLNPDIVFLQEVDYFSKKRGYLDQAGEIAKILRMDSSWICEIKKSTGGEGTAILSKYPILNTYPIELNCQAKHPGHDKIRKHFMTLCTIQLSNDNIIACCSVHLDPHYTGIHGRVIQYKELISKIKSFIKEYPIIIGGDFNTMCSGIGRCKIPEISLNIRESTEGFGHSEAFRFQKLAIDSVNTELESQYGITLNDPFDKEKDITFSSLNGLYESKLDWILFSPNYSVSNKIVGNLPHQHCSDHYWLMVDINND